MNEIAVVVQPSEGSLPKPFQNFNFEEMKKFYFAKQFLHCLDATSLLSKCVASKEEIRHYDGTYQKLYDPHFLPRVWDSPYEVEYRYPANFTVESKVWISTKMLMDKLDASLYFWRELNPELVRLLSKSECIELEVISNWVKMIHYMSPIAQSSAF